VTSDPGVSPYYAAVSAAGEKLAQDLAALRRREDAGQVTVVEAARERVRLLEDYLAGLEAIRREHLGGG
jgi:hypothetical protein